MALELGADAYLRKPVATKHLVARIDKLLSNRNQLRAYFTQSPLVKMNAVAPAKPDEAFLDKLNEAIQANLDDPGFDVDKLARLMNVSRTSIFRKIRSITDLTPNELVNRFRLKKAAALLAEGQHKIYEVSDMVGYASQTNFGRNFYKQFGITPKEYRKRMCEKGKNQE